MQFAHTRTMTGHDDTVRQYTNVRYPHTEAGLITEPAASDRTTTRSTSPICSPTTAPANTRR